MKKIIISVLLLLGWSTLLFAQDEVENRNTKAFQVGPHKNQLEVDVKNLFDGLGSATMLYKRVLSTSETDKGKNVMKLLRFRARLDGLYTISDNETDQFRPYLEGYSPTFGFNGGIGIGYEVQKIRNRWMHYHGAEIVFNYDNTARVYRNSYSSTRDGYTVTLAAGIAPFIGVKYFLFDRVTIGAELALNVLYTHQKTNWHLYYYDSGLDENVYDPQDAIVKTGVDVGFSNLRFLTLGYLF